MERIEKKPNVPYINVKTYYEITANSNQLTELLDGEIVAMASPSIRHQQICGNLYAELRQYIQKSGGSCRPCIAPTDVKLNDYTIVVPDVFIACHPELFDEQKYNGAPDFVAEVASSNRFDDFDRKLLLYRVGGVREYWIIDPKHEKTVVYFFENSPIPDIYTFDASIPVQIYHGNVSVRIADLLQ